MRYFLLIALAALLCVAGCNFVKETETTVENAETKLEKIEAEIARLKDHPWAGQYGYQHDHGWRMLSLAPENGFVLNINDSGKWDGNDLYGTVEWDGTHIKLTYEIPGIPAYPDDPRVDELPTEYRLVRWGERRYLILDDEIIKFCYKIHTYDEPRCALGWSIYLLRWDDWEKEVTGKPELPEEFLRHLLDERVDAVLLSVEIIGTLKYPAYSGTVIGVIDKGKKDGLLPGMELCAEERGEIYGYPSMRLTKVDETQSEGTIGVGGAEVPKIGQEFSTYPRWMRRMTGHIQE